MAASPDDGKKVLRSSVFREAAEMQMKEWSSKQFRRNLGGESDTSCDQLNMIVRVVYAIAMYGGLVLVGNALCTFTEMDCSGGFTPSIETLVQALGWAIPPMMALLLILEVQLRIVGRIASQFRVSYSSKSESESVHNHGVRAEAAPQSGRRNIAMASLAFCLFNFSNSKSKEALAGGLDKYSKRKKLDPLDTYVPTVLLAQSQFQEVDKKLEAEMGNEDGTAASAAVDQFLSALEDLDSLLLQASRSNGAPVERMKKDLTMAVGGLDRLLATVPAKVLEKSKAIAEAYKSSN